MSTEIERFSWTNALTMGMIVGLAWAFIASLLSIITGPIAGVVVLVGLVVFSVSLVGFAGMEMRIDG